MRYALHGAMRGGVASAISPTRSEADATLPVYIQPNAHFRLPDDDAPIIMIGAGTGVAPYRAFMQEREARGATRAVAGCSSASATSAPTSSTRPSGRTGSKHGVLTRMDVAFSRDGARKIYVQHRLREQARDVYAWLEDGAHLYVCGDAEHMAPDVHEAPDRIVAEQGGRGREARRASIVARAAARPPLPDGTSTEHGDDDRPTHRPQPRPLAAAGEAEPRRDAEGRQRPAARHDRREPRRRDHRRGAGDDTKLMKFHGIYQQDDRDLRDERRRQKLEPAYQFMVRVRLPGGVCTPAQWLKLDELARAYGGETLRLTTRQTFQFHGVLKQNLRATICRACTTSCSTPSRPAATTPAASCASVNPQLSALHAEVCALAKQASDHAIPKTGAYHEIWYGEERDDDSDGPEEPLYGRTYMPRKFKIGFAIPPINDIDVYTPGSRLHRHRRRRQARRLQRRHRRRHGPHRPHAADLSAARRRDRLHRRGAG